MNPLFEKDDFGPMEEIFGEEILLKGGDEEKLGVVGENKKYANLRDYKIS